MKNNFTPFYWPALLGGLLILAACGGGDSFTPPNISTTPVALSSSNQNDAIETSAMAAGGTTDSSSLVTGVVIEGAGGAGFNPFDFASSKLPEYVLKAKASAAALPTGVAFSETLPCDSGTMKISGNVADPNASEASAGDTISFSFNNCTDNFEGTTINGAFSASVISGYIGLFCGTSCPNFQLEATFNNLRVTEMGSTGAVHGGFNLTHAGSTDTFSGSSLYLIETGGESVHLTNFDISTATSGPLETTTVSMSVAGTQINGLINIETDPSAPLEQTTDEDHPHAGTLIITGRNNSSLTVEALNSSSMQVTLNADDDGLPDDGYPKTVTWTEIEGSVP